MPEMTKYGVFRDDIVFVICCYQRYIYSDRRGIEHEEENKEETKKEQ